MKYIKEVINELRQTTWPKPKALLSLLTYTIVICGIITLIIVGADYVLFELRSLII